MLDWQPCGCTCRAPTGHLIALMLLARDEVTLVTCEEITQRGFARDRNLLAALEGWLRG